MNSKKFIRYLSSVAVIGFLSLPLFSCGPEWDPDEGKISFFHTELGDPLNSTLPFNFTYHAFYSDEYVSKADQNLEEWLVYTNKEATLKDIGKILYKTSKAEIEQIRSAFLDKKAASLPDSISGNSFIRFLISKNKRSLIDYISYAKSCEFYSWSADPWQAPERDPGAMATLSQLGVSASLKEKDPFLKARFAYQAVRMDFFSENYPECIKVYNSLLSKTEPPGEIKYWALSLKAGALLKTSRHEEAAYSYAKVYQHAPSMRKTAYTGFARIDSLNEKLYFSFCKNEAERALYFALKGVGQGDKTELIYMQKTYSAAPDVSELELLMTRQIQILEMKMLRSSLRVPLENGETPAILATKKKENELQAKKLISIAQNYIAEDKIKNPAFWHMSASYLYFMLSNYEEANRELLKTRSARGLTNKIRDQMRLTHLLIRLNQMPVITLKLENELYPDLKWLEEKSKKGEVQFSSDYENLVSVFLAGRYHKQNDVLREILCRKADHSLLEKNIGAGQLEAFRAFVLKKNKTPFEMLLADRVKNQMNTDYLNELQGTLFLRAGEFSKAVTALEKVSVSWFKSEDSAYTPYRHGSAFLWPHAIKTDQGDLPTIPDVLPKLAFAKKMNELSNTLAHQTKEKDKTAALLANAWYNMSYYGSNWSLSHYSWSSTEQPYDTQEIGFDGSDYYTTEKAEKYYLLAVRTSKNQEFKAKCLFMAAACAQNKLNSKQYDESFLKKAIDNPYFPELKKTYARTAFYDQMIKECSYLTEFAGPHKFAGAGR